MEKLLSNPNTLPFKVWGQLEFFFKKLILLLSKDALDCSEVKVKICIMFKRFIFLINAVLLNFVQITQWFSTLRMVLEHKISTFE